MNRLVAFVLDRQSYALRLASVRRVVRMVEVAPLPKAPGVVLGVLDLEGVILPVLSMRRRFGLAEGETSLADQLLVAEASRRTVALAVNSVTGVVERTDEEITKAIEVVPGAQYVEGITRLEDGLLFIHDLDRFLSRSEDAEIHDLLAKTKGTA